MAERCAVGWMYRTEGTPPYIKVELHAGAYKLHETFADSERGAEEARDYVTVKLHRDDWFLEDLKFLGLRIVVPTPSIMAKNAEAVEALESRDLTPTLEIESVASQGKYRLLVRLKFQGEIDQYWKFDALRNLLKEVETLKGTVDKGVTPLDPFAAKVYLNSTSPETANAVVMECDSRHGLEQARGLVEFLRDNVL